MQRLLLFIAFFSISMLPTLTTVAQSLPPLLSAIKKNDIAQVNTLLNEGTNISIVDGDSDNVLMYAAFYSTEDCMRQLLQKGADPNAKNKLGETAVLWCNNDIKKIKLLLEYKANLNIKTTSGNTALMAACVGNAQTEIVKLMLQHGADPLVVNNRKENALMRAATYGDTSLTRLLLNKGVDINAKGVDDFTPLFYAIRSQNTEMVLWLLANGADADARDSYKSPPVTYALVSGDTAMINALLPKTTRINEQDIDGMTILMWAIYNEYDQPDIIQLLLNKGATFQQKDKNGNTALAWALKKGNTPTAELLRKAGAKE